MVDAAQRIGLEADFNRKRKTYFDANYGTVSVQNSLRRERRDQFNQWIEQTDDLRRVIDVGCGPAILYPEAHRRCETYYAMDIVESNLQEASENNERIETIQADLDSVQWTHDPPTSIICSRCIEWNAERFSDV